MLPAKEGVMKAVCPRCRGEGSIVNPSVDGHGITADEMDELGPEFMQDYLDGLYDVRCPRCTGLRVVEKCQVELCPRPVEEGHVWDDADNQQSMQHCFEHLTDQEREAAQEEAEYQAEIAAERRMGA